MLLKSNKIFAAEREFLAIPDHYVALTGKFPYASLTGLATTNAAYYGTESVIQRGTLVNMGVDGTVSKPTSSLLPNAVIFNTIRPGDFDSTDTYVNATILVHGFVRGGRVIELTSGDLGKLDNKMIYIMDPQS